MERRVERLEIRIDQRRCVNCVLSVILRHLAHSWVHGLTLCEMLEVSKTHLSEVECSLDDRRWCRSGGFQRRIWWVF